MRRGPFRIVYIRKSGPFRYDAPRRCWWVSRARRANSLMSFRRLRGTRYGARASEVGGRGSGGQRQSAKPSRSDDPVARGKAERRPARADTSQANLLRGAAQGRAAQARGIARSAERASKTRGAAQAAKPPKRRRGKRRSRRSNSPRRQPQGAATAPPSNSFARAAPPARRRNAGSPPPPMTTSPRSAG